MLQWLSKNKTLKTATILGVILVAVFLFFDNALAQSIADQNSALNQGIQIIQEPLGLPAFDIRVIIVNIIRWLLGLVGLVLVVIIMYAGYLWMTAGGNEDQITQAKSVIRNAVIGLAIILSAYSIVSFAMNLLGYNTGNGDDSGINPPMTENLAGSGALGQTIKDHYPARDQKDVPRNSKIVISFFRPILPSSFITDTNANGIYGDCVPTTTHAFNWNLDCDHVTTTASGLSDDFINVKNAKTGQSVTGLVALASTSTVNGVDGVFTLVLKPITNTEDETGGYLGSDNEFVQYTVTLGKSLLSDDALNNNPPFFNSPNPNNRYYSWSFTCDTTLDLTPPHVVSVFPDATKVHPRNTVIQISFDKPMNPIGLQGNFITGQSSNYFSLNADDSKNSLFMANNSKQMPAGTWLLVNNFKTLEFTPSATCGKNACGDTVYCLPSCTGSTCTEPYKFILKTAAVAGSGFSSIPFTGVDDLSGNALDGNHDMVRQNPTTTTPIFDKWRVPDNFSANFTIDKNLDLISPYIANITPGIAASNVQPEAPWEITFSKSLNIGSVYNIGIDEYPASTNGVAIWKSPTVTGTNFSMVSLSHGPFLKVVNKMYMPYVPSQVTDVNFNCFYPGLGPKTNGVACSGLTSDGKPQTNCCQVGNTAANDFCCNGTATASESGQTICKTSITNSYVAQ